MKLHLDPDNPLVRVSAGQPIDTTDMGHLIEHIAHSCTDERRSPIESWYEGEKAGIRVEGLNYFRNEAPTLCEFLIDTRLWLPAGVKDMTPRGALQRTAMFHNIELDRDIPESLFTLDEDNLKY